MPGLAVPGTRACRAGAQHRVGLAGSAQEPTAGSGIDENGSRIDRIFATQRPHHER